jgi:serine/threonine protein kinase/hemoglobin-like flavoprotein/class 3 adenylate cyclase
MQQVGKYRIVERIGQGAMGEVFRAHDPVLDRHVALKIIAAGDDDRLQRFHREAQSAARLSHPNIVVVHDFGEDSGRFFMAMELLEGTDLKTAIADNSIGDLNAKLKLMTQVCDAVAFAHARSIVHRDLKPANIFLLPNQQVKILDFGLARPAHSDMTGTGTILGTPHYMAPEQIKGQKIDARADVFALGTVFYELLASRRAFEGDSIHAVLYRVIHHDPEPLRILSLGVPPGVSDLVARALMKDPSRRFQSVIEMRDAIQVARGGAPSMTMLTPTEDFLRKSHTGGTVIWPTPSISQSQPDAGPAQLTLKNEIGGSIVVPVKSGQTLLEASLAAGVNHVHQCGGNARCSTCRVSVVEGAQNLSPRDSAELKLSRRLGFPDDVRLACQSKVLGPVAVRRLILDEDDARIANAEKQVRSAGTETPLAVLSASIREFSMLTRRSLAHDIVHILNRYYLQIGEAVLANGGHIDHYPPGGLIALFGVRGEDATTKCSNAVRAALRMQRRMETFNSYLREHFGLAFTLDVGLHYGRMIVGNIGHPDYAPLTAIGDAATLATAVAASSRDHDTRILATEELINIVEGDVRVGHVSHEILGGRDREYTLYEILDFAKPDTHFLVQSSWEQVVARREEAAQVFYGKLFEIAPAVKKMFDGVDMTVQGSMLTNMIAAAVKGLDRLDELKPVLQELGRRHAGYGVSIEHYAPVEACLLYTIEVMMGESYNLDVKLAWTAIYNFIAETMIEASMGTG